MSGNENLALVTDQLERSLQIKDTLGTQMEDDKEDNFSPLDIAIQANDKATVYSLLDKLQAPPERLLLTCLFADKKMTEEEVKTRVEIFEKIVAIHPNNSVPISLETLKRHLRDLSDDKNWNLTTVCFYLAAQHGFSLYTLPRKLKLEIIRMFVFGAPDLVMVTSLILLFCGSGDEWQKVFTSVHGESGDDAQVFNADDVLRVLDLTEAKKVISELNFTLQGFQHIIGEETLRILTAICPSVSACDKFGRNYLHVAAHAGNVSMIKHLKALNYDVNERDLQGSTPLMYIHALIQATDVTRMLLSCGAEVNVGNKFGCNVAHKFYESLKPEHSKTITEWTAFMLEQGFHHLFSIENMDGITPFEYLLKGFGDTHTLVALLKSHVPRFKVFMLRHAVYNYNDNQFMELLLRVFGKLGYETSYKPEFKNTDMLYRLDIPLAQQAFLQLDLRGPLALQAFKYTEKAETLELLNWICPEFAKCNREGYDYLRLAVQHHNASWIKLIWEEVAENL